MSFNEGRNIYLHEILVDYLKNTEEYSDENIQKKLVRFYKLKNKENIKSSVLSRDERVELSKLKTFFSKNLQITFSDSKLIYPRFKDAYAKAKSAIINLRSAYDNVIAEYSKLVNSTYYEYKDPKYLDYLNYIKKKIIIAKANAGILDYAGVKDFNIKSADKKDDTASTDVGEVPSYPIKSTNGSFDITSLQQNTEQATNGQATNGTEGQATNGTCLLYTSDAADE